MASEAREGLPGYQDTNVLTLYEPWHDISNNVAF